MPEDSSQPTQQPSSLKSRLEAFQAPSSSSASNNNDSQRPRVASGSLKDRIALFNANAESSKPLIPTAAFGTSAPPPGGPISRTTGGGMIGNRLPKLDPSSAGLLSRNIAQPVGARKVSENRGLYGNRIPSISKQHTGGSTTSVASSDVGRRTSVEPKEAQQPEVPSKDAQPDVQSEDTQPDAQPDAHSTVPEPRQPLSTSADLEEDAVDMKDAPFEARDFAAGAGDQTENAAPPPPSNDGVPIIRTEDLVPSTLPHEDEDGNDVSSDVSEPPSPRSTAAQGSETTPSIGGFSDRSSIPAISRISSSISVATTEQSSGTLSSLRVETGGPEDEAERLREASREVAEDQDNLSEVSTPTGTPTIKPRDHLPEISGSLTHSIGGLSLHPDGTVSPGVFGTAKKMPNLAKTEDQVMVDTSALPAETSKLSHEQRTHERNPDATETEMNKKGNEPESEGDFQITDDNMVHIELPEDDPALTEEGRQLQKLAKKKLAEEAEKRGVSEWQVMEDNSKDRPEHVKQEQAHANEKETGDPHTSFEELQAQEHESESKETDSEPVANEQDETAQTSVESKDFVSADKSVDESSFTEADRQSGTEGDATKSTQEEATEKEQAVQDQLEDADAKSTAGLETETPTEVIEPATPLPELERTNAEQAKDVGNDTSPTPDLDESTTVEDITDPKPSTSETEDIQDIEDIPTVDDTELHKKDQDPNIDSLIVGKHDDDSGGVHPQVEITEDDTVEDENETEAGSVAKQHEQSAEGDDVPAEKVPGSPSSVTSEIEEPSESPSKSNSKVASATFPSVPKQDPEIRDVSDTQTPQAGSRASTPAQDDVTLPSVPKDNVDADESAHGKVRVEVTLSPGKHLASPTQNPAASKSESDALDEEMNRFLAKKDGGDGVETGGAQTQGTASLDALAAASADKAEATKLAKSTSTSSTLSSSSSTSSKKKKSMERGRSPLLDMNTDGEDDGEAGWAKVSVNKTKYA